MNIMSGTVSIIIPTFNEGENIKNMILEIKKVFEKAKIKGEVIVVDDNSPDGTGKIAEDVKKKDSSKNFGIKIIVRKKDRGLSTAVIEGFKHSEEDIIGVIDADFSHPVSKIPDLVKAIEEGYDIALGSRYIDEGGIKDWSFKRRMISKGATLLSRGLTSVKDPMSGFIFLKKKILTGAEFNPKGYKIALEIIVKTKSKKVKEIPYVFTDRRAGQSKMGFREIKNYMIHLFFLYSYKIRSKF